MSSSVVPIVVGVAAIAWLAVLVAASVRGGDEQVPPNLAPWLSNEDLETHRLERVLGVSVVLAGFLAVSFPIYFLGETNRQASFEEAFHEQSVERGEREYDELCASCHGPAAVGGVASFVETRSGVSVQWAAPALDDIFYRYDRDEIAFWVIFGRPGSPMPAWGLAGGGPLNEQNVDDILNYLQAIQLPQNRVLAKVGPSLEAARSRLDGAEVGLVGDPEADPQVPGLIGTQRELIAVTESAPGLRADAERIRSAVTNLIAGLPEDWQDGDPVPLMLDTDGDGVTDEAERRIPELVDEAIALGFGGFDRSLAPIELDPRNPSTNGVDPDRQVAERGAAALANAALLIVVTSENFDRTLTPQLEGLAYLERAAELRYWEIDEEAVAAATFGGDVDAARRAIDVYNAYCARCHTSGWSPGMAFATPIGSGGFGPSLLPPRTRVQFQTKDDLRRFLWNGSESGVGYGVNGIGRGYMPGFGASLPADDIDLLIDYLWGDTLGGPELREAGG